MKTFKKTIFLLLSFVMMVSTVAFAAPVPSVKAESAILIEASTGKVLFEKDAEKKMYPASMTKLITAIIALDYFSPEDVVTVGSEINEVSLDSSKAGHIRGESITIENLIRGLIIPSGNDTAEVIASAVAKKYENDDSLSTKECEIIFSELMNKKAEEIGCVNTNFANPHGYHDEDHYTTASDMAKISRVALENELLMKICGEKSYVGNSMGSADSTGLVTNDYNWSSHNLLITNGEYAYPYATGLKTGFTNEAGDCVAASAEKDGISLIAIIFNSEDPGRWEDAVVLFDYGFDNYNFFTIAEDGNVISDVPLHNHNKSNGDTLDLVVKEEIKLFMDREALGAILTEVDITNENYIYRSKENKDDESSILMINAPIEEGTELGTAYYKYNGETIAETKVYAGRTVEKATFIEKVGYTLKDVFSKLFTVNGLIKLVVAIVIIIVVIIIIRLFINRRRRPRSVYKFKSNKRRRRF